MREIREQNNLIYSLSNFIITKLVVKRMVHYDKRPVINETLITYWPLLYLNITT